MPQGPLNNIKHVVMLMLENRSLDNLFGHLYAQSAPSHFIPNGSKQQYEGIPAGASNPAYNWEHELKHYPVVPIPVDRIIADGRDPSVIPWWDPTEEILSYFGTGHGVINQLFGDQHKKSVMPPYGTPARMLGFLQDYAEVEADYPYDALDILWTFRPEQLPNLSRAARIGAISDAWFASVPTDTNPNRAFSLCGTSLGRDRDSINLGFEQFDARTIFNGLAGFGKSCGLYYHDIWQKQLNQCYTQYTFPQCTAGLDEIATIGVFGDRVRYGNLPSFSYLEPKWGGGISADIEMVQGSDLHPPTSVTPGDQLVGKILSDLVRSPQWPNMLIILTFDEHGGTYDHVGPAWGALNPDGRTSPRFNFDLFGVRVPTILISPYIAPRTVFRAPLNHPYPFDHTSVINSLMYWCGGSPSAFQKRAAAAPDFWHVLTATDEEAADHSAQIQKALEVPLPPPESPHPVRTNNELFEGIGFASVRWIIKTSRTPEEVVRKIEDYRRDPEAFETGLAAAAGAFDDR